MKNSVESCYSAHSFSVNPGAICGSNILLGIPGIRNQKEFSVHESHVESGMHIKENHIEIGEKIEIKPELENHEHLKVRDTTPISSIGSIMAGVQEVKENWDGIREARNQKLFTEVKEQEIKDGSPEFEAETLAVEVVEENKEENKPVIAVDADPGVPDAQAVKEPCYTINEAENRELLDEIYYEDIAPYHEFDRVQSPTFSRPGSPVSELDYFGIAQNFVKAVVESAVEFGAELVTPGGVENYQKFKDGEISALEYTNLVAQDMARDATAAAIGAQIGGGLGSAAGFAIAGGGSIPGAAAGSAAGAAVGVAISRAGTAISRTLNKDKHGSTVLMNENHSKSACGGKTEKVVDREAQRKVGNVGKYEDLAKKGRPFNDGKDAHHMPSQKYLKDNGLNTDDGLSVIIEKKLHRKTRTYGADGSKIDTTAKYRDELATDLKDYKKVLQEEGVWKDRRKDLIDGLDEYKNAHPELFKKEPK